jgi:hypothetical protein
MAVARHVSIPKLKPIQLLVLANMYPGQAAEQKSDPAESESESVTEVSEDEVRKAIGVFQTQLERDHLSAMQAEAEGHGPGLRVLLKDREGKLLKAMTGTEFVKMREQDVVEPPKKGKILDRKY